MKSSTEQFIQDLQASISYISPLPPPVVMAAIDQLPLTGDNLREIYQIATAGAVNQFSRGFHDGALQYIAIAARAKKGFLARN